MPFPSKCATASEGCSSCTRPGGVFGGLGRRLLPRRYLGWSSEEVSPLLPVGCGGGSRDVQDGDTPSRSLGSPRRLGLGDMLRRRANGIRTRRPDRFYSIPKLFIPTAGSTGFPVLFILFPLTLELNSSQSYEVCYCRQPKKKNGIARPAGDWPDDGLVAWW